jgi:hypothetical protein
VVLCVTEANKILRYGFANSAFPGSNVQCKQIAFTAGAADHHGASGCPFLFGQDGVAVIRRASQPDGFARTTDSLLA